MEEKTKYRDGTNEHFRELSDVLDTIKAMDNLQIIEYRIKYNSTAPKEPDYWSLDALYLMPLNQREWRMI